MRYTSEMAAQNAVLQPLETVEEMERTAFTVVVDLCARRREWVMHVPPETDDPDIALSTALHQMILLIAEVRRLREQVT